MLPLDRARLTEALALAETAISVSEPNPRVGCIIGTAGGELLGRGATQRAGGAHAEVMALRDAQSRGLQVAGATAWVTLEPCNHHGRTPPCTDALVAAGLSRVVVAVSDPFPQVAGQGLARLRQAGISVVLAAEAGAPEIAEAARELNIGFFSRVQRGRPWVRMKIAASLDGRTALPDGTSQWITGPAARDDGHVWRRRASAVLTGIGTVLADDPRLDVRAVATDLQPLRVVVDSALRTPPSARLFAPPGRGVWIAAAGDHPERRHALQDAGATVLLQPQCGNAATVDLAGLLATLAAREVNELHVEAGPRLNGSLLQAGLVDELLVYLAPCLIGSGRDMAALGVPSSLAHALRFALVDTLTLGGDLRLRLRAPGPATF